MPMYNLTEYSDNYLKTSGRSQEYSRDEPALTDANAISNFHSANNSASLKLKQKITGTTVAIGTKNVEILVTLKNLINF